jgi:predicted DNA-binding ribbon-helix-helix protein
MWDALQEICAREGRSIHDVCTEIDRQRQQSGLTAGVRVFILNYFRDAATEEGHASAAQRRAQGARASARGSTDLRGS